MLIKYQPFVIWNNNIQFVHHSFHDIITATYKHIEKKISYV